LQLGIFYPKDALAPLLSRTLLTEDRSGLLLAQTLRLGPYRFSCDVYESVFGKHDGVSWPTAILRNQALIALGYWLQMIAPLSAIAIGFATLLACAAHACTVVQNASELDSLKGRLIRKLEALAAVVGQVVAMPDDAVTAAQQQLSDALDKVRRQRICDQVLSVLRREAGPPAQQLADALVEWHQQPQQRLSMQLELQRAAAARSCAYLHCAQVTQEGGAAAGEGVSSQRCGGCRTVWYCGTACSHADWRAGHRRVCKALAAERQAQKAAEAAAAQPNGQDGARQ
jgi:hypothetical protein